MSINKIPLSPLALREGFHVVLHWKSTGRVDCKDAIGFLEMVEAIYAFYFGSIRFSEDMG